MIKASRRTRHVTTFIGFLLFPVVLNFLSPYVSITGAMAGIVTGSVIVFGLLFVSGFVFGRGWCSHGCPWSAPSEFLQSINNKPVNRKRLRWVRYGIFAVWASVLILGFILAGGIQGIDPLYLTETGISVDEPLKYITYYGVIGILFLTTVMIGRRGACHALCWMSPFMVLGMTLGEKLRIPRFKVRAQAQLCVSCHKCDQACPMSIDVNEQVKTGTIDSTDCILCGACVDACAKDVLSTRLHQMATK